MLKVLHKKQGPRTVSYRNYKNFNNNLSKEHLKSNLEKFNTSEFSLKYFQGSCLLELNRFIPLKIKYLRAHQASFMNK